MSPSSQSNFPSMVVSSLAQHVAPSFVTFDVAPKVARNRTLTCVASIVTKSNERRIQSRQLWRKLSFSFFELELPLEQKSEPDHAYERQVDGVRETGLPTKVGDRCMQYDDANDRYSADELRNEIIVDETFEISTCVLDVTSRVSHDRECSFASSSAAFNVFRFGPTQSQIQQSANQPFKPWRPTILSSCLLEEVRPACVLSEPSVDVINEDSQAVRLDAVEPD